MKQSFVVQEFEGGIKISNNTPYELWIGTRPIPPKRKILFNACVSPYEFLFFDDRVIGIDWERIHFEFRKPQGKENVESDR